MTAPVVILGELVGLRYGPAGVAAGLSVATGLLVLPVVFGRRNQTPVSAVDMLKEILPPLVSILIAAGVVLACWNFIHLLTFPFLRLLAANGLLFGVYLLVLCFVMGQKAIYLPMLQDAGLWPSIGRRQRVATAPSGSS